MVVWKAEMGRKRREFLKSTAHGPPLGFQRRGGQRSKGGFLRASTGFAPSQDLGGRIKTRGKRREEGGTRLGVCRNSSVSPRRRPARLPLLAASGAQAKTSCQSRGRSSFPCHCQTENHPQDQPAAFPRAGREAADTTPGSAACAALSLFLWIATERDPRLKKAPLGPTTGKSRVNQQLPGGQIRTADCWRLSKGQGSAAGRGLKECWEDRGRPALLFPPIGRSPRPAHPQSCSPALRPPPPPRPPLRHGGGA